MFRYTWYKIVITGIILAFVLTPLDKCPTGFLGICEAKEKGKAETKGKVEDKTAVSEKTKDKIGTEGVKEKAGAKEKGKIETVVAKSISGTVVYLCPKNDPKVIGIADDKTETDYYFHADAMTSIVNKQSLKEINIGDTIEVNYNAITEVTKDGEEKTKHIPNVIRFIKSKTTGLVGQ